MSYGQSFDAWKETAGPLWADYTRHEFVAGLGDGTLPRAAFLHYLVQDYLFLIHFSRAWALAITKAETVDEMRHAAATVNGLINEEMTLHIGICAKAGLSEDDLANAQERPENIAYTRTVLDAGHSGDLLDLLASLAPCVMGYGDIGLHLKATATSDAYKDWIATYSSDDYQQVCLNVGTLLDTAVARRIGDTPQTSPRWDTLCNRFRLAVRLEVGFWDMGLTP